MPPYARIYDFLPEDEHQRLLDWALSIRDKFKPATVSKGRPHREFQVDPERRIGLTTRKLGPLEELLRERMLGALPELMARTGTGGPRPTSLELELAAHADGAYYRPHIDIPVGAGRQPLGANAGEDRVLSAVYYFYSEPRAFSGGQLRLYSFGPIPRKGEHERGHVDVEPVRNSLVAFPSWVPHEVRPIACPSCEFRHYRFALNCWYCRALGAG
ncbi:MAG TPA: 2OG-Fe(II) oxygenase [Sphingomicrobium sp.]|nr:2OG-Fe(II) oxygenase [Sphingomicrobium sp.]